MDLDKIILWGSVILVMLGFGTKLKVIEVTTNPIQCSQEMRKIAPGCRVINLPTKVYVIK